MTPDPDITAKLQWAAERTKSIGWILTAQLLLDAAAEIKRLRADKNSLEDNLESTGANFQAAKKWGEQKDQALQLVRSELDQRRMWEATEYMGAVAARKGIPITDCPYHSMAATSELRDSTLAGLWQRGHDTVTRQRIVEENERLKSEITQLRETIDGLRGNNTEGK